MDGVASPWFATSKARRLFSISAFLSVGLILFPVLFVATSVLFGPARTIRLIDSSLVQIVGFLLGVIGAPAALFLWLGMLWHARVKRTSLVWLFFLIVGNWLVAPLYYRFVFRQSATETQTK
jgi:hypothetical protein